MARKRGSLTLSNYGKKKGAKKKTTRREKTPEEYEIAAIVNDRLATDPYRGEFKVRWKGYGEEDDTWETFESLMKGEWNCQDAVIDYLAVQYEGEKVLLTEKDDDGRTLYSVVDKNLQLEWVKTGEVLLHDESAPGPPPKEPTPAPSIESLPKKPPAKPTAVGKAKRRASDRIRGKHCKRLGLREHRYSTRAQSARTEPKPTSQPSRKRKQDTPEKSDSDSIQFLKEVPASCASAPPKPVAGQKRVRSSLPSISSRASSPEIPLCMVLTLPRPVVPPKPPKLTQEEEDQLREDLAYSDTSDEEDGAGQEHFEITAHDEPRAGKGRFSPSAWMFHVAIRPPFNSHLTLFTYQECVEELPGVLENYLRFVMDGEMQRKERMEKEDQRDLENIRQGLESVAAVASDPEGHRLLVEALDRKKSLRESDKAEYQAKIFRVLERVRSDQAKKTV